MLNNFTIKTRTIFVLCLLGVELIAGAALGLVSLGRADDELNSLYDNRLVCLGQLDKIVRALNLNQLALAESLTASPAATRLRDEVTRNKQTIDEQWRAYMATELTGKEAQLAKEFERVQDIYLTGAFNPALAAVEANDLPKATELVHGELNQLFLPVRKNINELIQLQLDTAQQQNRDARATYQLVRLVCLSGIAIGLVIAAVIGTLLVRGIVNPLNEAIRIANAVAEGDLTQEIEVTSADETGRLLQALRDMNAGLVKIVGQVRAGTDTIATAAGQIASGNMDLSSRTEQQASALEETASSMEELTSTVKQNADSARQANTLSASAADVAAKGGAVVAEVVRTMDAINGSASKIVDIISVIDGIAFQTNILALNAAVEAARAGEQGRGFAVVATEVRTLAQRSASAAKEIKALIDDSVNKVKTGTELVDTAGATMVDIVESVGRVSDIMAEISAATREQTSGIEQVSQAVVQLDETTQQNAALVEEASAAAQQLHQEAEQLAAAVSTFRLPLEQGMRPAASAGFAAARLPRVPDAAAVAGRKRNFAAAKASVLESWETF